MANPKLKEAKFHINIGQNDLEVKLRAILGWLKKGSQVRLTVQLRGRENAHPELGVDLLERLTTTLGEASTSTGIKTNGNQLTLVLNPKGKS